MSDPTNSDPAAGAQEEWTRAPLARFLALNAEVVDVDPDQAYPTVGVLNRGRGLLHRDPVAGSSTAYKKLNRIGPGVLVYSRLKAFEGAITVTPDDLPESFASQEFPTFAFASDVDPDFFRILTTTQSMWDALQGASKGMGGRRERVKPADFLNIVMDIPPLPVQERIVEVIGAIDDEVTALETEADALTDVMTVTRSQLLQPGDGWDDVAVGHLAEARTGRAFPDKYQGNAKGEVPYFKVADMNVQANIRHLTTPGNWLDSGGIAAVKPRICPPGTVVFPIIGAALSTEKRRLLIQPSAFDQNLMGLVPNDRVAPEYLLAVMSSIRLSDLTQPGAVPSVNQKIVSAIRVPLAPREVQEQIVKTMDVLQSGVDAKYAEAGCLRAVRAGLLSGLLDRTIEIESAELEV